MLAAAFLGLAYCALPTLLFGLIRPQTVSLGKWPKTRRDVGSLAFLQAFVGLIGFGLSYEGGKFGMTVSMHNLSLAIVGISALSALVRLARGPKPQPAPAEAIEAKPAPVAATPAPARSRKTARKPARKRTAVPRAKATPAAAAQAAPPPLPLDQLEPRARAEVQAALDNVEKLRRWIGVFAGQPLAASLTLIAEHAEATILEVIRDPGDFARVRQALVHYLTHVVAVMDHLATVHIGTGRQEHLDRTAETLERLVPVFESYRTKAFENDTVQLDARLAVLDQEIQAHTPPPQRAAGS